MVLPVYFSKVVEEWQKNCPLVRQKFASAIRLLLRWNAPVKTILARKRSALVGMASLVMGVALAPTVDLLGRMMLFSLVLQTLSGTS